MFNDNKTESLIGGKSIAVPTFVKTLAAAHDKFGKLSWSDCWEDTIKLAKNGFEITEIFGKSIKGVLEQYDLYNG